MFRARLIVRYTVKTRVYINELITITQLENSMSFKI